MSSSSSLDDLLREIEAEQSGGSKQVDVQSAGLENLPTFEAEKQNRNSSPFLVPEMISQVPQLTHDIIGGGKVLSEQGLNASSLSARQRSLPKISLHMVGSVLAVFVLMIGLGSSVLLSQRTQDVRQQAYEGQGVVEEQPGETVEFPEEGNEAPSETRTVSDSETAVTTQTAVPWWQQPIFIAGIAIVLSAALLLAAFFHWLFAA